MFAKDPRGVFKARNAGNVKPELFLPAASQSLRCGSTGLDFQTSGTAVFALVNCNGN